MVVWAQRNERRYQADTRRQVKDITAKRRVMPGKHPIEATANSVN